MIIKIIIMIKLGAYGRRWGGAAMRTPSGGFWRQLFYSSARRRACHSVRLESTTNKNTDYRMEKWKMKFACYSVRLEVQIKLQIKYEITDFIFHFSILYFEKVWNSVFSYFIEKVWNHACYSVRLELQIKLQIKYEINTDKANQWKNKTEMSRIKN